MLRCEYQPHFFYNFLRRKHISCASFEVNIVQQWRVLCPTHKPVTQISPLYMVQLKKYSEASVQSWKQISIIHSAQSFTYLSLAQASRLWRINTNLFPLLHNRLYSMFRFNQIALISISTIFQTHVPALITCTSYPQHFFQLQFFKEIPGSRWMETAFQRQRHERLDC